MVTRLKEAGASLHSLPDDGNRIEFFYKQEGEKEYWWPLPKKYDLEERVILAQVLNACRQLNLDHQEVFPDRVIMM